MNFEASEVWYATDRRARSAHKVLVYDDIGALVVRGNRIEFRGRQTHLVISPVDRLRRARQSWNWLTYLLALVAMSPIYAAWWFLLTFFVVSPGTYVIVGVLALVVVGRVLGGSVTWVVAVGHDDRGRPITAWFASGERRGWAGIFGGTRRLHESVLRALELKSDRPSNQPAAADGGRGGQ
jgi:hypothetical protein